MPLVLADAVVRVGLDTSALRKEARALGVIGGELNKIASTIFKFAVAPAIVLGTLGVKKFLETTDSGARELKKSLSGLHYAWDQLLARIGKAIYSNTALGRSIKELVKFINSIDEAKLMAMFDNVKLALFAFTLTKIVALLTQTVSGMIRTAAAMATIGALGDKVTTRAGMLRTITSLAAGKTFAKPIVEQVGMETVGRARGGMSAAFATHAFAYSNVLLSDIKDKTKLAAQYMKEGNVQKANLALKEGMELKKNRDAIIRSLVRTGAIPPVATALPYEARVVPVIGGGLVNALKMLDKAFAIVITILGVFRLIFSYLTRMGVGGGEMASAASSALNSVTYTLNFIMKVIESMTGLFADLGTNLARLTARLTGKGLTKEEWDMGFWEYTFGSTMAPWKKSKTGKNEPFDFIGGKVTTSSFADLNKLQQSMTEKTPIVDNTDATRSNTETIKENSNYLMQFIRSSGNFNAGLLTGGISGFAPAWKPNF